MTQPEDWRAKHREAAMRARRLIWAPVQQVSRRRYRSYWCDRPGLERSVRPVTKRGLSEVIEAIDAALHWGCAYLRYSANNQYELLKQLTAGGYHNKQVFGETHSDRCAWRALWVSFEYEGEPGRIELVE